MILIRRRQRSGDERACSSDARGPRPTTLRPKAAGTEAAVPAFGAVALYNDHVFTPLSFKSLPCIYAI